MKDNKENDRSLEHYQLEPNTTRSCVARCNIYTTEIVKPRRLVLGDSSRTIVCTYDLLWFPFTNFCSLWYII